MFDFPEMHNRHIIIILNPLTLWEGNNNNMPQYKIDYIAVPLQRRQFSPEYPQ